MTQPAPPPRSGPHGIEFLADDEHPGGVMLIMDDVRQSYVDMDDPTYLDFEYIQFFACALASLPAGPLTITHIGGGGLTMARYLNEVRPGSTQLVLEPNVELTELVRARLPLPRRHRIRIRPQTGRVGVAALASDSADVILLDAYADGQVPAELTTMEFFAELARVVRPNGMVLANVVDEPGLAYVARVIAGLATAFGHQVLISSTDILKNRRFGNIVLLASATLPDTDEIRRQLVRQPFPSGLLDQAELARRFPVARPFTDADSQTSPEPQRDGWRIR